MKLSMSLLGYYLRQYQPECYLTEDQRTIRGIRFLSDLRQPRSGEYVYLDEAGSYFRDKRYQDALLLVNGYDQILCPGVDRESLLNDVLSAFEFYNQFELTAHGQMAAHAPLSQMLETMSDVFPSPVLVFGLDGTLLSSAHSELLPDVVLSQTLQGKTIMGANTLSHVFVDEQGNVSHDLTDQPQHLMMPENDRDLGAVSMYLFQEEERVGFIMMFPRSSQEVWLAKALEPLFAQVCLSSLEFTSNSSVLKPNRSILKSLLSGEPVAASVVHKLEQSLHLKTTASLLALENQGIQNYTLRTILIREFSQPARDALACELDGKVLILSRTEQLDSVLKELHEKMPFGRYSVGISMPIQNMRLLPAAYKQANFAIESAQEPGIRYCRTLAPHYLLRTLAEQDMTQELLHPAIALLRDYDSANGTELLPTLHTFLDASCNQADTAASLNIHLNTLKYRLRRICEIGTVDLKDEEELFYLRLSFHLSEMGGI